MFVSKQGAGAVHCKFVNLQKHMSDAGRGSESTAVDDVTGGDVQAAGAHWLSLSVFPQSQVRRKLHCQHCCDDMRTFWPVELPAHQALCGISGMGLIHCVVRYHVGQRNFSSGSFLFST